MKFLVIGDSWAHLDPKHGHFLNKWATQNGNTTEHWSRPGGNNVIISSDLLNKNLSVYDAVFYFAPDLLRASLYMNGKTCSNNPFTMTKHTKFLQNLQNILDFNNEKTIAKVLGPSEEHDAYNNVQPNALINLKITDATDIKAVDPDSFDAVSIRDFYADVGIEWLARANYLAMKSAFETIKKQNVPVISMVSETIPGLTNKNLYNDADFVIGFDTDMNHLYQYRPDIESKNHIDEEDIDGFVSAFDSYVQKNIFLKTLLYK